MLREVIFYANERRTAMLGFAVGAAVEGTVRVVSEHLACPLDVPEKDVYWLEDEEEAP